MRRQRQEKSQSYRNLPYFQHLGSDEVFEALDRVRQANLLQMQLKMQKDNVWGEEKKKKTKERVCLSKWSKEGKTRTQKERTT
ncbi:unnamed protein product [Durusdinium trenchii]|uniref:Uncharacterized protein n=2 Tax=Durusdinium trenchii TaxID=1381693 RepID=A0ABP0KL35_9DINO